VVFGIDEIHGIFPEVIYGKSITEI
jgi:hypothetical protein